MGSKIFRLSLLEGLPAMAVLGLAGVLLEFSPLTSLGLAVPLVLWLGAATHRMPLIVEEARDGGIGVVVAVVRSVLAPVVAIADGYRRLGLWRGRWLYDLAALLAFGTVTTWRILLENGEPLRTTVHWIAFLPLLLFAGGVYLRFRTPRSTSSLMTDVFLALDAWQHRRRRDGELAYENAVADHLDRLGFDVTQGVSLETGRQADIVVRPKGQAGQWDWRDVMIEMKAHLTKTTERDRAIGQVKTYSATWPGSIVLMICGDYRSDLLRPLETEVAALQAQGRPIAMLVKGRPLTR
jgi:hypothetical protein